MIGVPQETSSQPLDVHNHAESVDGINVQAGVVHGGVHVHPGHRVRLPPPHQLPPASPRFTDRRDEATRLEAVLTHGFGTAPTTVMVSGPAGVGKTALAVTALCRMATYFPDGLLYVDLAATGEVSPTGVLGRFLRAFGIPPDAIPDTEAERVALWSSCSAPLRLAVLLETPASIHQIRPLLPASPHSFTLITGRRPLPELLADGAVFIPVEPLDPESSHALLREHFDVHNKEWRHTDDRWTAHRRNRAFPARGSQWSRHADGRACLGYRRDPVRPHPADRPRPSQRCPGALRGRRYHDGYRPGDHVRVGRQRRRRGHKSGLQHGLRGESDWLTP